MSRLVQPSEGKNIFTPTNQTLSESSNFHPFSPSYNQINERKQQIQEPHCPQTKPINQDIYPKWAKPKLKRNQLCISIRGNQWDPENSRVERSYFNGEGDDLPIWIGETPIQKSPNHQNPSDEFEWNLLSLHFFNQLTEKLNYPCTHKFNQIEKSNPPVSSLFSILRRKINYKFWDWEGKESIKSRFERENIPMQIFQF